VFTQVFSGVRVEIKIRYCLTHQMYLNTFYSKISLIDQPTIQMFFVLLRYA
jgi:hypothetical protein